MIKLFRLLRLNRILTFLRLNSDLKAGFRIIFFISMMAIVTHWTACFWYMIISLDTWEPPWQIRREHSLFNFSTED